MRLPSSSPSASTATPTIIPPVSQKRSRQRTLSPLSEPSTLAEPEPTTGSTLLATEASLLPATGASPFRNVSACYRCRRRKHKCDQRLPACSTCEKAGEKCVGYDPIAKRHIPRRYAITLCKPLIPFYRYDLMRQP